MVRSPAGLSPKARWWMVGLITAALVAGCTAIATVIETSRQHTVVIVPAARVTFGDPPFRVPARASSGLPVRISVVSGPCAVTGDRVRARGAGTCRIRATQDGGDGWHLPASATSAIHVSKARQTIAFAAPPPRTHGDPPFAVAASASSGLPVTFRATGACAVGGTTVTLLGAGQCSVTATQRGSADYLPATVTRTFPVAPRRLASGTVLQEAGGWGGDGQLTIETARISTRSWC